MTVRIRCLVSHGTNVPVQADTVRIRVGITRSKDIPSFVVSSPSLDDDLIPDHLAFSPDFQAI
jgi:hypothetical protein